LCDTTPQTLTVSVVGITKAIMNQELNYVKRTEIYWKVAGLGV
jgi:hypothetical protein